jgi:hypothetical protein
MEWLYWLSINVQDGNHSGIEHRYNPFHFPEHADPGPDIWSPPLGPNSVGNWIMAAILLCALLGACAPRTFGILILVLLFGGMALSVSGKFGYF